MDKFANEKLLPEMKKVFPKSSINKKIIGEVIGFNRVEKSEACEFVSSITGDNSREVVSFGTEAGLFQEIELVQLFVDLDLLIKLIKWRIYSIRWVKKMVTIFRRC